MGARSTISSSRMAKPQPAMTNSGAINAPIVAERRESARQKMR
jgi:hypothetical protein